MYVGHIGIALGVKGWKRSIPLSALVIVAQGPDWIDTVASAFHIGSDHAAMWSHSLPSAFVGWRSFATASTLFATYLSHLPADYITGRKPLVPGAPLLGLGLYDRPRWDFAVELIVILVGWLLWRTSLLRERRNRPAAWMLLAGLIAIQAAADFALSIRNANVRIF